MFSWDCSDAFFSRVVVAMGVIHCAVQRNARPNLEDPDSLVGAVGVISVGNYRSGPNII